MAKVYILTANRQTDIDASLAVLGAGFRKYTDGQQGIVFNLHNPSTSTAVILDVNEALTLIRILSEGVAAAINQEKF